MNSIEFITADSIPACGQERKCFRVANGFERQIDIELRPVQMIFARPQHGRELLDRGFPEPRKLRERNEQLFAFEQQAEPEPEDMRDFDVSTSHQVEFPYEAVKVEFLLQAA